MGLSASVGAYGLGGGRLDKCLRCLPPPLLLLRWRFFSSRTLNASVAPARRRLAAPGLGVSLRSQLRVVTGEDWRRGHVRAGLGGACDLPEGGALPFFRAQGVVTCFYWARGG